MSESRHLRYKANGIQSWIVGFSFDWGIVVIEQLGVLL